MPLRKDSESNWSKKRLRKKRIARSQYKNLRPTPSSLPTITRQGFSKIKDVYLRLYDYKFDHGPRESHLYEENPKFVGRDQIKKRIRLLFDRDHSKSDHGAYLVTGYRGMGKTSLVRESLSQSRKDGSIESFEFFLSQDDVRDIDLLRQIGWKLSDYAKGRILRDSNFSSYLVRSTAILFFLYIFLVVLDLMVDSDDFIPYTLSWSLEKIRNSYENWWEVLILRPFIFIIIGVSIRYIIRQYYYYRSSPSKKKETKTLSALLNERSAEIAVYVYFPLFFYLSFSTLFDLDQEIHFCLCNFSLSFLVSGGIMMLANLFFPSSRTFYRRKKFEDIDSTKNRRRNFALMTLKMSFVVALLIQIIHISPFIFEYLEYNLPKLFQDEVGIGRPLLFFALITFLISAGQVILERVMLLFPSYKIKKDLEMLLTEFESRLYANVVQEKNGGQPLTLGQNNPLTIITGRLLGFFRQSGKNDKNTLNYQVATTKEIEQFLFRILNKVQDLRDQYLVSSGFLKDLQHTPIPKFVFIVDELDKVEPNYYFSPGDRESDELNHHSDSSIYISTKARKRQEAIAKLLANLKGFLNNAEAKFIFIGGRGMYDAALADISDRESFYSSIFNEVIYVPSFFRDKITRQAGLTEMTEFFITQYLIKDMSKNNKRPFKKYLEKFQTYGDFAHLPIEIRFKIIHLLQNFFVFSAYRSNGSPKKLIEIFEKYVVRLNREDIDEIQYGQTGFIPSKTDTIPMSGLYLKFSYKNQYEINLTSNLYRPYIIIHSRHMKSLGDKLLYSSAFLMDHILKFHKAAFSFRNLELIPDIILANKDPNLRHFFQDIMGFLSKMHIRQTVNAIFQYKFYSRMRNELMYMSKISEFSSAAFNFTLDESYHLKSYYKKKLAAKYKEYKDSGFDKYYIHSIGYLHSLIGDLHYYDEEYDDAIIHYTDAVQPFRAVLNEKKKLQSNQFVLFTRSSLSLGLCLEKLQSFDKAYSVYRNLVLQSRMFNAELDDLPTHNWEIAFNRMQLFLRPSIALLHVIDKSRPDGITFDNLVRNMDEYLQFLKLGQRKIFPLPNGELTPKYSYFDDEPKVENDSYSWTAKPKVDPQHRRISRDKKRIFTLITDYYINIGSLLYFKNKIYFRLIYGAAYEKESTVSSVLDEISKVHPVDPQRKIPKRKDYFPSISSYLYYLQALKFFMIPYESNYVVLRAKEIDIANGLAAGPQDKKKTAKPLSLNLDEINDRSEILAFFLSEKHYSILNTTEQVILADILGKLGDALLASIKDKISATDLFDEDYLKKASEYDYFDVVEIFKTSISNQLSIKRVIAIYLLAAKFYKRAGRVQSSSLQLKKILYVIREVGNTLIPRFKDHDEFKEHPFGEFIYKISKKALSGLTNVTEVSNRAQIKKFRTIGLKEFTKWEKGNPTSLVYNNNSTSPEVREIILITETVKRKYIKKNYESNIYIGDFSTVSDMFTRILELKYQSEIEFGFIVNNFMPKDPKTGIGKFEVEDLDTLKKSLKKTLDNYAGSESELIDAIVNGFFCLYESIRILNTYGVDYILNYSFLAAIHYRIGKFSLLFEVLYEKRGNEIKRKLEGLVGNNFLQNSGPYFHFDKSIYYNRKAIQMHSEGAAYKETSRTMYTLDDDFNDNFVHFCAAIERYRINVGDVRTTIDNAKIFLEKSLLNQYDSYLYKR